MSYQNGYRDGYDAARHFYGRAAADRLGRIAEATQRLRDDIEASGGRPPARLLAYFDEVDANTHQPDADAQQVRASAHHTGAHPHH